MDPLSMIAMAGTVVKSVETLVSRGAELEQVATRISAWYTLAADINQAEREAENPPIFRSIMYAESVESEALNATLAKQALVEQERVLREAIMLRFGIEVWRDLQAARVEIRDKRKATIYKQRQRRRAFIDSVAVVIASIFTVFVIYSVVWLIKNA
tara:strand:- start:41 stop:508 length:468 start_codon:yes stop_codon:yes gene_type:complete